jgi:predicted O-linked N-acetylglucosamine transferase (SPINDLY family)
MEKLKTASRNPGAGAGTDAELRRAELLYQQKQIAEAAAVCEGVLEREPERFDALRLLGNAQLQLDQPSEAVLTYDRALLQQPDFGELLYNRGNALQRLKRFEDAIASYDHVLRLRPESPECLNNRGTALQELKRPEEALASYDAALRLRPNYPGALNNKGLALLRSRRPQEAAAALSRALELRPEYPLAWANLSMALGNLRRFREALASADHALQLESNLPETLITRGMIRMELAQYQEASNDFRRALELDPNSPMTLSHLAAALLRMGLAEQAGELFARLYVLQPDFNYVQGDLLGARRECCDWVQSPPQTAQILELILAGRRAIRPFQLLSISDGAAAQLSCARIFAADTFPSAQAPLWRGERYGHKRIRVAYLSPDFREHPVSNLMAGVFERHDLQRFEITAISVGLENHDATAQRIRQAVSDFVEAGDKSDSEIASLVRARETDIVIDLKGFTDAPRDYLAFRPAPVQVNYLGFPGSLGSPFHDYIVADEFVIPRPERCRYSEKVVYLPECFQANDACKPADETSARRSDHGLPESGVVLASFNNCHKITPEMFDIWMGLLIAVPESVLWIFAGSVAARDNLARAASRRGVDAKRLIFASREPYALHLARLTLADLFLDTLPFNGGATVSDALRAGVPVITCAGEAFASRMAGSQLCAIGLPELVTYSLEEYEAQSLALASDPRRLRERRDRLAYHREITPLFDTPRFCRHLEAAYAAIWQRADRGERPEHIEIPSLFSRDVRDVEI